MRRGYYRNHLEPLDCPFAGALPENGSAPHAAPGVKWIRRAQQFALEPIELAGRLARNLGSDEIDRFDQVLPVLPGSMTIYGSSPYSTGVISYHLNSIQKTPPGQARRALKRWAESENRPVNVFVNTPAMDPLSPPLAV